MAARSEAEAELGRLAAESRTASAAGDGEQVPGGQRQSAQYKTKSGYLTKRGHFIKSWRRRWFKLEKLKLTYSKAYVARAHIVGARVVP